MDIDQLKDIWQSEHSGEQKPEEDFKALLKKRSNGPIATMKRNLFIELIFVLVTYTAVIIYYFVAFNGKMEGIAWYMLAIALIFIGYFFRKNKLLNEMQCVSFQVKSSLETQVKTLEKYVRFYLIAGILLAPISLVFFAAILYLKLPAPRDPMILYVSDSNPLWKVILVWFLITIVVTALVYYANIWYIRKLYGKHIQKLKEILKEIEVE
jgi:4-hydroxybenzoate polyprenyltransferase